MKPLLVGEDNPYGKDPRYALFPYPERSAGGRLCRVVLGMTCREYMGLFDRRNLCDDRWSSAQAYTNALKLIDGDHDVFILLGRKVAKAFGVDSNPVFEVVKIGFEPTTKVAVLLPHPSGRCRVWNEPDSVDRARRAVAAAVESVRGRWS